ncbi:MAG: N-acetyl-gamma-glutamyl-phosphate reductase [Clostridia bacterium]|nr:N-acetyl-gamma-glutamyl-phosphate reductase [Clostridia bacterium]
MKKVFIDGRAGTTGLRIEERLRGRDDLTLISLSEEKRKDPDARREILNRADIVFLCLPDEAAREAVSMIERDDVAVIDASTAHRTNHDWAYGFAELGEEFEEKIKKSNRIAVPGCHASGFIALVYPLIKAGILPRDARLTAHSVTGYSGGGKKMIADYETAERSALLGAPRQYGITQSHKHLPEMVKVTGLTEAPLFSPIVADFYSGMEVTVPIFKSQLCYGGADEIRAIYRELYTTPIVRYNEGADEGGFLSAASMSGLDTMSVEVYGNGDRILLVARYDNLGKGASGAAVECLNIKLGTDKAKGLSIGD